MHLVPFTLEKLVKNNITNYNFQNCNAHSG